MRTRLLFTILLVTLMAAPLALNRQAPLPPPLHACPPATVAQLQAALPPYQPTGTGPFVRLTDRQFTLQGAPFVARGVNYYPMRYPWRRFLSADLAEVERELALLQMAGFNTLRVFLWYEALFQCEAEGAVPEAAGFQRFDAMLAAAAAHGFRLIVTLHDLPDLAAYPLYSDPPHTQAQTAFIVERYRDEPAILAWDLRNEGDIDYSADRGAFRRDAVLAWLERVSARVRALDHQHLITAGWLHDAAATAAAVDFISFHHWAEAAQLPARIAEIRAETDKPILLEEIGYNTLSVTPEHQRELLADAVATAEAAGLLGWLVWTAFDFPTDATCFPPPCTSPNNQEHYFGLWTTDYTPKPALAAVAPAAPPE